jgi:hypothetical protein
MNSSQRTQPAIAVLTVLVCVAGNAPAVFDGANPAWLPDWLGAAIALGALVGILLVYRQAGALRTGFLLFFLAALALAAAAGAWNVAHG